jgi:NADH-quinone oxidoreductase subunit J
MLIYVGAIAILIIFAVMLTQRSLENQGKQLNASTLVTLIVILIIFSGLVLSIRQWMPIFGTASPLPVEHLDLGNLGLALTDPQGFALPFEVTSILLLAAMIGSIYIAYERKEDKK